MVHFKKILKLFYKILNFDLPIAKFFIILIKKRFDIWNLALK